MAERRKKHGDEPTSVFTDGHPLLMEQGAQPLAGTEGELSDTLRIADLGRLRDEDAQCIAALVAEREAPSVRLARTTADADARHDIDRQRTADVLRHNGELVEEKRLLETKLRDTIQDYEGTVAVLSGKLATMAPHQPSSSPAPRRWTVRQSADDLGLETLLNLLSELHWTIDQIYEPRGGAYRVIAWQEHGEEAK